MFLHGILTLADYLNMTFRVFHIVLWASYLLITGDARHNKVTPNGRSGIAAIQGVASCRTRSYNKTPVR
jgi:hypothetical protein